MHLEFQDRVWLVEKEDKSKKISPFTEFSADDSRFVDLAGAVVGKSPGLGKPGGTATLTVQAFKKDHLDIAMAQWTTKEGRRFSGTVGCKALGPD